MLGVGGGNGAGGIVVGGIEDGVRLIDGILALDAHHAGRGGIFRNCRIHAGSIGIVIAHFLRLGKAQGVQRKVRLGGGEGDLMGALFQIELEGFVEQSVGIADPAGAPHLGLHLCGAHLIAGAVGLDVLLVPVDLVQGPVSGTSTV